MKAKERWQKSRRKRGSLSENVVFFCTAKPFISRRYRLVGGGEGIPDIVAEGKVTSPNSGVKLQEEEKIATHHWLLFKLKVGRELSVVLKRQPPSPAKILGCCMGLPSRGKLPHSWCLQDANFCRPSFVS